MRRLALTAAAIAAAVCAAISGLATAQEPGAWSIPLRWPDGREVQWRAAPAAACDGSNVDLKFANNSATSGMARMKGITFACVRRGEFEAPERSLGLVMSGGSTIAPTLSCMCADQGGVRELLKVDLDFLREGDGSEIATNGCTYSGEFTNGQRGGRGVYACPNGMHYDGYWLAGQQHGNGTLKLADGQTYTGEFVNGRQSGRGSMTYADKSTYDGEFTDGRRNGVGTMHFKDGSEYVGEWKADQRDGYGVFISADKSWTYDGGWVKDQRQGEGKLSYNDGSYVYRGPFVNDQRTGNGEVTFGDGRIFRGAFVADEQTGPGVLTFPDGRKITGDFRDHQPHGRAIDAGPNATFDGEWANGRLEGRAVVIGTDGLRFEGMFSGGLRNGLGRQWRTDGSSDECRWLNDVAQKPCKRYLKNGKTIEFR